MTVMIYLLSFLLRFDRFFGSDGLDVADGFEMTVAGLAMWNSLESSSGRTSVVVVVAVAESRPPVAAGCEAMFSRDRDLIRWRSLVRDILRWFDE
jgi:hypothetical protein